MQLGCLEFYTCSYGTCWLFAFSASYFSLSVQFLPLLMGFLCQKQMSYGHRPPASITLFALSFHQLFSLSRLVVISCTEQVWTLLLLLLLFLIMQLAPDYPVNKNQTVSSVLFFFCFLGKRSWKKLTPNSPISKLLHPWRATARVVWPQFICVFPLMECVLVLSCILYVRA